MGKGQGPKPSSPYTSAFSYLNMVSQASYIAKVAGKKADAVSWEALRTKLDAEFNDAFLVSNASYDVEIGGDGFQTAQALALALGVSPDANTTRELLLKSILENSGHYTTGIVGSKFLFEQLYLAGHEKTALDILMQTDYPSIGFYFADDKEQATENLWELPDALVEGTGMNSRNHHMWSSYSAYLVRRVGGVDIDLFQGSVTLRPAAAEGLSFATTSMKSVGGRIVLSWRQIGGKHTDKVYFGDSARFDCGASGGTVEKVDFVSFGSPRTEVKGENFLNVQEESCHWDKSLDFVERQCLGKNSCEAMVNESTIDLMKKNCGHSNLRLWASVVCSKDVMFSVDVEIPMGISKTTVELPSYRIPGPVRITEGRKVIYDERNHGNFTMPHGVLDVRRNPDGNLGRHITS